ncbi:MAG: F0F1 ATP synthase subunit B [Phycisphaerae bacterium]
MERFSHRRIPQLIGCIALLVMVLSAAPALGAESGDMSEKTGNIGQAIASLLIFFILLAVLGKFAWKPIAKQLRNREESISEALKRAEKREQETQDLLRHYRARMDYAEAEAEEILARSRKEASEAREKILDGAREEARRSAEKARADIERAKKAAMRDLYGTTAELATDVAASVMQGSLTEEQRRKLLEQSLSEISSRVGEKRE